MDQHRFLVVGQAQAPGQCELVSVNTELSSISQRIGSAAPLTCIQDQAATIANVVEEFKKSEFVHLACHGVPDPKQPFESGFALGDGLLKVEDIMRYDLHTVTPNLRTYLLVIRPLETRRVRTRSSILLQPCSSPDSVP